MRRDWANGWARATCDRSASESDYYTHGRYNSCLRVNLVQRCRIPVFAAIDIGSNSVRLKISKLVRRRLSTLHEDREVTRLGEAVFQSGMLDPEAMGQTVKVLKRLRKATELHRADTVRV